jgi:hypothetical protein
MEAKESLQKFLDSEHEDRFKVTDDSSANWALRKIAQHKKQMEQNNLLAEEEIHKIEAWNKQVNDEAQQSIDYFQSLLAEYAETIRNENPKFKTLKLPSGRIRYKKQQPKWNYDDEQVVQALKEADMTDYIKVKETPSKSDIKKAFVVSGSQVIDPETGIIIPGIEVEEREDKFEVVTDE